MILGPTMSAPPHVTGPSFSYRILLFSGTPPQLVIGPPPARRTLSDITINHYLSDILSHDVQRYLSDHTYILCHNSYSTAYLIGRENIFDNTCFGLDCILYSMRMNDTFTIKDTTMKTLIGLCFALTIGTIVVSNLLSMFSDLEQTLGTAFGG